MIDGKRSAGAAEEANLVLQFVGDVLLAATLAERVANDGKGPLGNADRLADLGHFAVVLDLAERFDEARSLSERGCFQPLLQLLEHADRDVIRLDAERGGAKFRKRLDDELGLLACPAGGRQA